ncbi:MAG: hypothetical protein AB7E46_00770 [Desulfovibrio sp.]
MLDTKRRIYAQGDLDGACFLYSIVNAYVALTGRAPDFERVCAAFSQAAYPADFLNASVGTTGQYDRDYALLQSTIERMLAQLGGESPDSPRFHVQRIPGPFLADSPNAQLDALLDAKSVVILRYQGSSQFADNMDHWVCAVAHDSARGSLAVACSVRHQRACNGGPCGYVETFHSESGRWSNDALCPERAYTVVEGEVFRVRVVG